MIKIEKGVPIPPKVERGGQPRKYPLRDMEVGDSFVTQWSPGRDNSVRSIATQVGIRITVRRDGDTLRVWRIA